MNSRPTLLVIAGPTAVGKTAMAIALAQHFNVPILSADSRQCYREMCIGVARPSANELAAVHHYFVASHSIHHSVDAAGFEAYGLEVLHTIFAQHPVAVMVGGTGLYIQALCQGLDTMPPIPEELRQELREAYGEHGLAWLQQEVKQADPAYFASGEIQNPHRLLRALEVVKATGQSIRIFQQGKAAERPFTVVKMGLTLPRSELCARIDARVDQMMEAGLLEEVKSLYPYRHLQALQTVGYQELFDYLDGHISLDQAVADIKTNTRRYAKRQMTWFRKDETFQWFAPGDAGPIIQFAESKVASQ